MEAEKPELCRLLLSLRKARLSAARDVQLLLLFPKNLVLNMEVQHQDPLRTPVNLTQGSFILEPQEMKLTQL